MEFAGVILAGGQSRRFGEDKRYFRLSGKCLIEWAIEKLRGTTSRIYIVVDNGESFLKKVKEMGVHISPEIQVLSDFEKFKGPLFGIYSFFNKSGEEGALFIPVDMPHLPPDLLRYMIDLYLNEGFHLVFVSDEHPLPCVVSKELLGRTAEYLKQRRSLRGFFAEVGTSGVFKTYKLEPSKLTEFGDPHLFLQNINTRDDIQWD